MQFRPVLLCLALLSSSVSALAADTHVFDLFNLKGIKLASASYTVDSSKKGIKVHSKTIYETKAAGTNHSVDYAIGADGLLDSATIQNMEDHILTFYSPSKTNDALTIRTMKAAQPTGAHTIALPTPEYIIAFQDDPSVWQVLMDTISAHPHSDNIYRVLVPATAKVADRIEPFRLNPHSESTGTLDGKPIPLKHYVLTFNAGSSDIYTDADGKLMQARIKPLGVHHVRSNFALDGK